MDYIHEINVVLVLSHISLSRKTSFYYQHSNEIDCLCKTGVSLC